MTQLVDIFPIQLDLAAYPLRAFRISSSIDPSEIGGTYAHRVRKFHSVPCAWVRDEKILVSHASFTPEQASELLQHLWQRQEKNFDQVDHISPLSDWTPSPSAIAQLVAKGVLDRADDGLSSKEKTVRNVRILPEAVLKGIVVDGAPALAITIHSEMRSNVSLERFHESKGADYLKQINLMIGCRKTKGRWDGVVGKLGDRLPNSQVTYREHLRGFNPTDYDASLLQTLPDDHLVIGLRGYSKVYKYPIRVVYIIISMENMSEFGNPQEIIKALRLQPADRKEYVDIAVETFRKHLQEKYQHIRLLARYDSTRYPRYFAASRQVGFSARLRFGDGHDIEIRSDNQLLEALKNHGLYRLAMGDNKIQYAVIDLIGDSFMQARNAQLKRLNEYLRALRLRLESSNRSSVRINAQSSIQQRSELRAAIQSLAQHKPDLILIYLPQAERRSTEADSLYNVAKSECLAQGIASQIIFEETVTKNLADGNILAGIIGKTGNIPYVLAEPLGFLDVVVGLDIARERNPRGGSTNVAAMSRIYLNTGEFSGHYSDMGVVQGETLPRALLESLFSRRDFGGKRVAIHRDGPFRGNELQDLQNWAEQIGATFFPIEIIKSGTARMYRRQNGNLAITRPEKADVFYLSSSSAYVASSPPPFNKATPQPILVNNYSSLTREQAVLSVLALTLVHYGSLRPPRLPASVHASDKIADLLRRNIRPNFPRGIPFWL